MKTMDRSSNLHTTFSHLNNFLTTFISIVYENDRNLKCRKVYFLPKIFKRFICLSLKIIVISHSRTSCLQRMKTLMMVMRSLHFVLGNGGQMALT